MALALPRRRLAALAALLPLVPGAAWAQPVTPGTAPPGAGPVGQPAPAQAPGQLVGVVVRAADGLPAAGVGVTVRAGRDSALVAGALTRADGSFRIDGLRPGRYTVRARALGFAPLVRTDVVLTPEAPRLDLGRLALAAVATQLSEVGVRAERSTEVLAPDRNSYTVKDMPTTSGGTAVDVLRNVPAVEVDGENNVALRGNGNVVVQINGRISPLRGAALGNFLAQLPATVVARVEVVSNPSAKNDPEGLAGIVNIVLKQQTDLGRSGGFTVAGASTGQASVSGNLGYQQGLWTLFGSYGYQHDRRTVSGFTSRDLLSSAVGGTAGLTAAGLDADVRGVLTPDSHSATGTAEYRAGARDVLANNLVVNRRALARDNASYYRALAPNGTLTGRTTQQTDQRDHDLTFDEALTWRHTVDPQKNALSAEVRYTRERGLSDLRFTSEDRTAEDLATGLPPGVETNVTDGTAHTAFAQADWTRALRAGTKLEMGYKGTFRQETNDFDVARLARDVVGGAPAGGTPAGGAGAFVPDLGRSNAFDFRQQVHAAYGVLSQRAGKFDLQAGLRLERARTRFDLATTGQRYDRTYADAFPSALASYNVTPARQFKASYSKRIARPDAGQLNPFGFREDAFTVFTGNPRLQPEYTHAFELGYQQSLGSPGRGAGGTSGTLQVTPFLRHTVNAVRRITTVGDDGILRLGFDNAATNDQYGTDATVSLRRGRVSGLGGASVFEQVTDATNLGAAAGRVRAFGWSARANATVKLTPSLDVQGFGSYRAPLRTEQGRISRFALANVAVRQKIRGDQASATLRVIDPFGTTGWGVRSSDGRVAQLTERHFGARGLSLSVNYAFGKAPKLRPRPAEPEAAPAPPGGP